MKTKRIKKKLHVSKLTISNLNSSKLNLIKGGVSEFTNCSYEPCGGTEVECDLAETNDVSVCVCGGTCQ